MNELHKSLKEQLTQPYIGFFKSKNQFIRFSDDDYFEIMYYKNKFKKIK